jgi:hypothetical protein
MESFIPSVLAERNVHDVLAALAPNQLVPPWALDFACPAQPFRVTNFWHLSPQMNRVLTKKVQVQWAC